MERRKSKRIPVKVIVDDVTTTGGVKSLKLIIEDAFFLLEGEDTLGDISEGGLYIPLEKGFLNMGEEVQVTLTLPNSTELYRVAAKIAWLKTIPPKKGLGINFKNISQGMKEVLMSYIEEYEKG